MDSRQASLARSRLELALHVLEVNRPSNPGIMRCIQVLRNCLPEPAAPYDGPYENANGFSAVLGESDCAYDVPVCLRCFFPDPRYYFKSPTWTFLTKNSGNGFP